MRRCVSNPHISELGRRPPQLVGKLSTGLSSGLLNTTLRFFLYPSTQDRLSGRGGPSGSRGDTGEEFGGRNNTEEESLAQGGALRSCSLFVGGGRDEQSGRGTHVHACSVMSISL